MKKTSNKSVLKKCARKTGPYSGPYAFFDFGKISPAEPVADIPVNGKTVLLYKWRARCIKIDSLDTVKLTEASQYSLKDGVKIAGFSDHETQDTHYFPQGQQCLRTNTSHSVRRQKMSVLRRRLRTHISFPRSSNALELKPYTQCPKGDCPEFT